MTLAVFIFCHCAGWRKH